LGPLQIFANTFPVHYSAPNGFNFEVNNPDVDVVPVQVLTFNNKKNVDVILHFVLPMAYFTSPFIYVG